MVAATARPMKAAAFDYVRAVQLEHALELLELHGGDARLIAGGQSLVPMMAMRLARPTLLVDINRIASLQSVSAGVAALSMGACVCQRDVEDSDALAAQLPLMHQALRWVGHQQTRNRGTVGGSLAYADPSAELPLVALVLGATMQLQSRRDGVRRVAAQDFFLGPMATAIGETECLTSVDWPVWQGARIASAFDETAIRHGDFAMASAACQLQLDLQGTVVRASLGLGGVGGAPMVFPALARQMLGQTMTAAVALQVAHDAARETEPSSDMHASADYRRHLAQVLLSRVLLQAGASA